jgi:hypothetical protein
VPTSELVEISKKSGNLTGFLWLGNTLRRITHERNNLSVRKRNYMSVYFERRNEWGKKGWEMGDGK